jgi:hypothetical protein
MATLLVGYDLNRPGQNYSQLFEELKRSDGWWHHLDSTWLVVSGETPVQLRDRLTQHIDSGDELLVIDVSGDPAAWAGLSERAGGWIKTNL